MNHTRIWIPATIIAVVLLVGFALLVPHTRDVLVDDVRTAVSSSPPEVVLRDTFKKGVHTITGTVDAPNACTSVSAEATLQGDASTTESIAVDISMPSDTGICLQIPTPTAFQATLTAPAELPITVTVNGVLATTSTP